MTRLAESNEVGRMVSPNVVSVLARNISVLASRIDVMNVQYAIVRFLGGITDNAFVVVALAYFGSLAIPSWPERGEWQTVGHFKMLLFTSCLAFGAFPISRSGIFQLLYNSRWAFFARVQLAIAFFEGFAFRSLVKVALALRLRLTPSRGLLGSLALGGGSSYGFRVFPKPFLLSFNSSLSSLFASFGLVKLATRLDDLGNVFRGTVLGRLAHTIASFQRLRSRRKVCCGTYLRAVSALDKSVGLLVCVAQNLITTVRARWLAISNAFHRTKTVVLFESENARHTLILFAAMFTKHSRDSLVYG